MAADKTRYYLAFNLYIFHRFFSSSFSHFGQLTYMPPEYQEPKIRNRGQTVILCPICVHSGIGLECVQIPNNGQDSR